MAHLQKCVDRAVDNVKKYQKKNMVNLLLQQEPRIEATMLSYLHHMRFEKNMRMEKGA